MTRRAVLALSSVFDGRGGIPRFNQMLCMALDELAPAFDLEGSVFTLEDPATWGPGPGAPWSHLEYAPLGGQARLLLKSLQACAAQRPDILLIGHVGMTPVGVLCGPFLRRGFGFIAHGTEAWNVPRFSRRFAVRRARLVFSVSRYTAEALGRATGLDPERIRLLPNTLAPAIGSVADVETTTDPPEALEILSVSRLAAEEGYKGIDHTLETVARLATRYPALRYRVVGRGSDKPRLVALATSLGLGSRVAFEEDLPDSALVDRYQRCAAFVLPSGGEGFGIVFLEAMRFGKPCVGCAAGGTPEVIEDGRTGFLVPYGDVNALESVLDRLIRDADLRKAMGDAGRLRVEGEFVFPRFRARLEAYLTEWLGLRGRSEVQDPGR